jgi:hypothetical protein
MIALTVCGALCGVAHWWTTPYVFRRELLLNGALTEDWVFRRVFPYGMVQIGLVQHYSNGRKALEIRYLEGGRHVEGYPRYWLDDGTEVTREEFERAIRRLRR